MRIAVVHRDRCHSRKCGTECIIYCPRVRTGDETVIIGEDEKAVISEELCVGCGKCVKGCNTFGNGSLYLQVKHDRCVGCNECSIARDCPAKAYQRVPVSNAYLLKTRNKGSEKKS